MRPLIVRSGQERRKLFTGGGQVRLGQMRLARRVVGPLLKHAEVVWTIDSLENNERLDAGVLQARRPHGSDNGNRLVFGAGLDLDIANNVAANRLD